MAVNILGSQVGRVVAVVRIYDAVVGLWQKKQNEVFPFRVLYGANLVDTLLEMRGCWARCWFARNVVGGWQYMFETKTRCHDISRLWLARWHTSTTWANDAPSPPTKANPLLYIYISLVWWAHLIICTAAPDRCASWMHAGCAWDSPAVLIRRIGPRDGMLLDGNYFPALNYRVMRDRVFVLGALRLYFFVGLSRSGQRLVCLTIARCAQFSPHKPLYYYINIIARHHRGKRASIPESIGFWLDSHATTGWNSTCLCARCKAPTAEKTTSRDDFCEEIIIFGALSLSGTHLWASPDATRDQTTERVATYQTWLLSVLRGLAGNLFDCFTLRRSRADQPVAYDELHISTTKPRRYIKSQNIHAGPESQTNRYARYTCAEDSVEVENRLCGSIGFGVFGPER